MKIGKIYQTLLSSVLGLALSLPAQAAVYEYDELQRLIGVQYDFGKTVNYTYDAAGNLLNVQVNDPAPPQTELQILGPDGTPLANTGVSIDGTAYVTDADGKVLLDATSGEFSVTATGYQTSSVTLTGDAVQVTLTPEAPPAPLQTELQILGPDGAPLANTGVSIDGATYITDADGKVLLDAVDGEHNVTAEGYQTISVTLTGDAVQVTLTAEAPPAPLQTELQILGPDGTPLANTGVSIDGVAYITDADGKVLLDAVDGEHNVTAEGYQIISVTLTGDAVQVTLTPEAPPAPLQTELQILKPDGTLLADTNVSIDGVAYVTDTDGRVLLDAISGEHSVEVAGYAPMTADFSGDGADAAGEVRKLKVTLEKIPEVIPNTQASLIVSKTGGNNEVVIYSADGEEKGRFDAGASGHELNVRSMDGSRDGLAFGTAPSGMECKSKATPGSFDPVLKWAWNTSPVLPDYLNVMSTPGIIDLDGDNTPDVVFGATNSRGGGSVEIGVLRALSGSDGTELFTVMDPELRVNTASSVAVGDIDLDGKAEIIASDSSGRRLIAFEHDGIFKWRSPELDAINWGAPAIADLDGDNQPEIIMGRHLLNNAGELLWTGSGGTSGYGPISLVADVDMDGNPDIVAGNTVYTATGDILWRQTAVPDGKNALGNFDEDDFPELVVVADGRVWLLEHDGAIKWGPVSIPEGGNGGPPTVADFDNDNEVEIGIAGASRYAVFETDGSLKWAVTTVDKSSSRTGSSVFDFEGDGAAEVVYSDEYTLRIFSGAEGTVLFEMPLSSCTRHEYPLVADVNADGGAEIVAVANNNCGIGVQRGIYVIGDQSDSWVPTRKIWNQHTYHISNIHEDGTVPAVEQHSWLQLNNYRQNLQTDQDFNPVDFSCNGLEAIAVARGQGSTDIEVFSLEDFSVLATIPVDANGVHFDTGDLDGDGISDFSVATHSADRKAVDMYLSGQNWQKSAPIELFERNTRISVSAGDVDGDGQADLIGGDLQSENGDAVSVFLTGSNESLVFPVFGEGGQNDDESDDDDNSNGGNHSYGVKVFSHDLNCDGKEEIIAAMADKGARVEIYGLENGAAVLLNQFDAFDYQHGIEVSVGDVIPGGMPEIVVGQFNGDLLGVFDAQGGKVNEFSTVTVGSLAITGGGSCSSKPKPELPDGDYYTSGRVKDDTGAPIPDVTVRIENQIAISDARGYWEITGLQEGSYTLHTNKPGLVFAPIDFETGNGQFRNIFSLKPLSELKVRVIPHAKKHILQGETLTFTLKVFNGGSQTATGILVQNVIPENTTLVSLQGPAGAICDDTMVACQLPDIVPGGKEEIILTVATDNVSGVIRLKTEVLSNEYPADARHRNKYVIPHFALIPRVTPNPLIPEGPVHFEYDVRLSHLSPMQKATGILFKTQVPDNVQFTRVRTEHGVCDTSQLPEIECAIQDFDLSDPNSISKTTVYLDGVLTDPGLLAVVQKGVVSAQEHPSHARTAAARVFVKDVEVDLVIALDVSFSMDDNIEAVKRTFRRLIREYSQRQTQRIALVSFRDNVSYEALTDDPNKVIEALDKLRASGGGSCEEGSGEAVKLALDHLKPGAKLLIATDAPPHRDTKISELVELARAGDVTIVPIITEMDHCASNEAWRSQ
ncbi:MAG: VWA domain-containing protein [Gammaproteobacteria bacterium]|nr:VWA domain-containing protein [Gammaproteobacteria bacterium]